MDVIELGSVIFVSPLQPANAALPMVVIVFGKVISVMSVQSENA